MIRSRRFATVASAAGLIAVLTLLSRVMGLVRKLAQSAAVSDSPIASAYDTANTVPNVLFEVAAGGALAGAVIPLISRFLAKKLSDDASRTASALLTWIVLVSTPIVALVLFFARPIVAALLGAGADSAIVDLSADLLRIFAIQVPLYGLSVVLTGVLQAHRRFFLPALSPLMSSVIVTAAFLLYAYRFGPEIGINELTRSGIYILGWGTTAGVALFSLPQLIPVMQLERIRPTLTFPPGVARQTLRLAGAGLAALLAQQAAILTIMWTANSLGDGGTYATFNYAFSVFMVPYAVLAVPVATAVFPRISEAADTNQPEVLRKLVGESTRSVLGMGFLAAGLLFSLAPTARIVLELGNPIAGLDIAMRWMAPALVGYSLLYHGARVLYALDAGKRVVISNSVAWGVAIVCLLGTRLLPIGGRVSTLEAIGVSLSIGMTVGIATTFIAISRELGRHVFRGFIRRSVVSLTLTAAGTGFASQLVDAILTAMDNSFISALLAAVIGGAALGACGFVGMKLSKRLITTEERRMS